MAYKEVPQSIQKLIEKVTALAKNHPKWVAVFENCFSNTLLTTVNRHEDDTTFVLTGDIPAMWLRDSTAQVRPYLVVANEDDEIYRMIAGLVKKQFEYICIDPYANAFNELANGKGHQDDQTEMSPWVWERKYEVDSLCYPIQLGYLLWKATGKTNHFDETFTAGVRRVLDVWELEQNHNHSAYRFERETNRKEDTLSHGGKGSPVLPVGMTWSGFRPSDDSCIYHYLVPSNMFAVVVLEYLEVIFSELIPNHEIFHRAKELRAAIKKGIEEFAIVRNQEGKEVYAYEVDGFGNFVIMDDANVPSLLAAPYLGYCEEDDPIYLETRKTLLSKENPYYFDGVFAKGIGSEHTPKDYVWPIALAIQGLTTSDKMEKEEILNTLCSIDAGTNLMHEGVDVNNPNEYTREWFSWSNMMFCELLMDYCGMRVRQ